MDLVTLGETLICLTAESGHLSTAATLHKSIGGAESNTAVGLSRLGHDVAWVSRVGTDPFGDEIVRTLGGEGVDVSHVGRSASRPTAVMVKERRAPDDIHVYYYRAASAAAGLQESDVPDEVVVGARRVHLTGITLALGDGPAAAAQKLLSLCKQNGIPVSFDPNLRLKLWSLPDARAACEAMFGDIDDLLVNEQEACALAGEDDLAAALRYLDSFGFASVTVKRGAAGVLGVADGSPLRLPAWPGTTVVDTVGAGDAFNAGFLHARLLDQPFEAALRWGTAVAGFVVAHPGDYEGLPSRAELDERLRAAPGPTR